MPDPANGEMRSDGRRSDETDLNCFWDPEDPSYCFDHDACGCYVDPCAYFGVDAEACCAETACGCQTETCGYYGLSTEECCIDMACDCCEIR